MVSIVDTAPAKVEARVRFWDRAGSSRSRAPILTRRWGCCASPRDASNTYYVENVARMFCTPGKVTEAMVRGLAHADGVGTIVGFHQDPASAGKLEAEYTIKALDTFDVHSSLHRRQANKVQADERTGGSGQYQDREGGLEWRVVG